MPLLLSPPLLVSFAILGAQLRAPLKHLKTIEQSWSKRDSGTELLPTLQQELFAAEGHDPLYHNSGCNLFILFLTDLNCRVAFKLLKA